MSALTRKEFWMARTVASPSPPEKAWVTLVIVSRITGPPAPVLGNAGHCSAACWFLLQREMQHPGLSPCSGPISRLLGFLAGPPAQAI